MRNVVRSTDIVVIGAGVIGAAVAFELVRRGASVTLVDARTPGHGATQASGGMLAPYTEASEGGPLLALGARSLQLFRPFADAVRHESGLDLNYKEAGSLHLARTEAQLAHFESNRATLASMDVPAKMLAPADIRALEPAIAADVLGALHLPSQAHVSASALAHALIVAATRRGATLVEGTRVTRVSREGSTLVAETTTGTLRTSHVVIAAGAWAGAVPIDGVVDRVPVTPIRGQLLHLKFDQMPIARVTWDERTYLVPWDDGTLLVGATMEDVGFDEHTTASGVKGLIDAACRVIPSASAAHVAATRAGLRPATPDGLPLIGWSSVAPGVMYATGHFRNGVLLAPLTASLVADAMLDGRIDPALATTSPARFGAI